MKNPTNYPSFSSTLLDEIYKEIDGSGDGRYNQIIKQSKENDLKKQSINGAGGRVKGRSSVENEEMGSIQRACLIEKWMEKKVNQKVSARRGLPLHQFDNDPLFFSSGSLSSARRGLPLHQFDNDPLFFSSGSLSSDSSFGGFSSSENESLAKVKTKVSLATSYPKTKIVRTSKVDDAEQSNELYLFDDYNNFQTNKTTAEGLFKSKARARKIYANLKKIKQPISPGGRLTTFINSIFTNGNPKKNRDLGYNNDTNLDLKTKSTQASTCSSASSFSRSCLSRDSPNSRQKRYNGVKRSVRFYPVSVIVDEDCRPCGHKCIYDEDFQRPMPRQQTNLKQSKLPVSENKRNEVSRNYQNLKKNDFATTTLDDDFQDDAASDSSSDLFELDHLALFKNDGFCDDLPVYGTTNLGLNQAIR